MSRPVNEIPIGTPIRWTCKCGNGLVPIFLTEDDKRVGMTFGSICTAEVITEEEVLRENPKALRPSGGEIDLC